jgi:hypothetical protein
MTTTPDFRALCAELLDELQYQTSYETNAELQDRARAALATPSGPPKNCWLDDEPDLCPSPCVFEDPSEVINNCTYAQIVKCKTDCQYYRAATPPPEPPTGQIIFNASPTEEVIRLNKEGFHYKGQFIADAGEAHRLMLVFLEQNTKTKPEPPTDEELLALKEKLWDKYKTIPYHWEYQWEEFMYSDAFESALSDYRAVLERWGK